MPTPMKMHLSGRSLNARIDLFLVAQGLGFNPADVRRRHLPEIIALECETDEALARMGLRREDILRHVFRDLFAG